MTWDATQVVNDARAAGSTIGLQVKGESETSVSGWRKFRSLENGDTSKAPKLVVTFNKTPNTPTGLTVSPGNPGYSTSTTPTLSAIVTDPDGAANRGYFEVKSGSTVVWSGSSAWATSGARVEVTVPSGILTNGTTYTVNAYSEDDVTKSTAAATSTVTVDTTAPTATLTATGYPNNTWSTPSSNTFTWSGPSDTATYEMMLDGVPVTRTPNSGSNYVWNSGPWPFGWHVWEAVAVDNAGNRGPTTTLNFGAGYPGFSLPQNNAQSTSTFPVDISAPPGASSATLQWKLTSGGSWTTATHVTQNGTTWSGAVTTSGGRSTTGQLLWTATDEPHGTGTLEAPALISIKACFHYPSAADKCTDAYQHRVQLVPSAYGDSFPTASLGPASVALFTGETSIGGMDGSDSKAGLGRSFSSYDSATVNAGLFGPGWSQPDIITTAVDARATVVDNRSKDGSFVIVDRDSGSQTFVADSGSTTRFVPLEPTGDATSLTFTGGTGGNPDTLELTRPLGSGAMVTTWELRAPDGGGASAWTATAVTAPGTASNIAISNDYARPVFVRESAPGAAATCNATTQTTGCRGLKITYTGSGSAMRVASVARVIGASTQAAVVTTTIGTYTYDGGGKLTSSCGAIPAAGKPALCTSYAYTTVSGRTLISELQPAGLKKWRFDYDGAGRLTTVKREKPTGGDATWSVDYSLTTTASGLPDLSASAAAQWGQQVIPTKVFAVYEPFVGSADVSKASLYYTTPDGTVTNEAEYGPSGWLVDSTWYDGTGNVVQTLDGKGWARVQQAAAADRPRVAAEASSYTVYNAWGGDGLAGTRVVDRYGPVHTASLKDGTVGVFRTHTHTMYDDSPDVDTSLITNRPTSTGLGLAVREIKSVSDAARTTDYDSHAIQYGYDPIVVGDGNGWILGSATSVSTQVDSSTWSTQITRFDSSGREIESRQPGGAADGTGAGSDAHSTVTTYYTAGGSGDCGGKPAWDGLVCKIGPAAQPGGATVPIVYNVDFNESLQPVSVQEISGGTITRTTTSSYDALSRLIATTKTTSGSGVMNEAIATTNQYDDDTGLPTTIAAGATIVTTGYDSWGRPTTYLDADGTSSSTTYDAAGNVATFNDGTAAYIYNYDGHNMLNSIDAGGSVGTFAFAYTSSGDTDFVDYPNGVVAKHTRDQQGTQTGLTYSQGSTELLAFANDVAADGRAVSESSPASERRLSYDDLGRLTKVEDSRAGGCVTRTYGFDGSSNRTNIASYSPGTGGACQSASASVSRTNTYDAAGRITNSGYGYDTLGRTLTTPQIDAGSPAAGPLASTYHANDMVAALSQNVVNVSGGTDAVGMAYALDPVDRVRMITTTTNGAETARVRYRFAGESDAPSGIDRSTNAGITWSATRYVRVPHLGMVASVTAGTATLQLANLHGDIVATMANATGTSSILGYYDFDEYGKPAGAVVQRYGWLGSYQRSSDALGGLSLMGARLYNSATGAFLTADPVPGGNVTAYAYPQDPINQSDVSGLTKCDCSGTPPTCMCRAGGTPLTGMRLKLAGMHGQVKRIYDVLDRGLNRQFRQVDSKKDLGTVWYEMIYGGKLVPGPYGRDGVSRVVMNGKYEIQWRWSKRWGSTIDIKHPVDGYMKVHLRDPAD